MSEVNHAYRGSVNRVYACDSCARRKIKCEGPSIPCEWCSIHNFQCTFRRNARVVAGMQHSIEALRGQEPEATQNHSYPRQSNSPTKRKVEVFSAPSQDTLSSERGHLARLPVGISSGDFPLTFENVHDAHALSGLPIFSKEGQHLMENCTGEKVDFDPYVLFWPPWRRQRTLSLETMRHGFAHNGHINLPDRHVVLQNFQAFCHSPLSRWLPVLNEDLFSYTIQAAYDGDLTYYSPQQAGARACVFAFTTLVSSFPDHLKISSSIDVCRYAYEAQRLLFDVLQGPPTLDSIQTGLILILYYVTLHGDMYSTETLLASTARSIFMLGAHRNHFRSPQGINQSKRHVRKLFWIAYTFDKELCLRTGRPPTLPDDECDLDLPDMLSHGDDGPEDLGLIPFFPCHLPLSILQSRIYRELYSVKAQRKSETELLMSIRELDVDLDLWMNSNSSARERIHSKETGSMRHLSARFDALEIQYHYCVIAVHQAVSRCRLWIDGQAMSMEGINSSLHIAVNESRSLLTEINTMDSGFGRDTFWFHLFYILMSIMTLFSNVISDPSAFECISDVRLMEHTAESINLAAGSHPELGTPEEIHSVTEFVSQLSRLGRAAIKRHANAS